MRILAQNIRYTLGARFIETSLSKKTLFLETTISKIL